MSENKPLQVLSRQNPKRVRLPNNYGTNSYAVIEVSADSRQSLYDLEHEAGMGGSHRPEGDCRSSPLADRESRRAATDDGRTVDVRPLEELPGQVEITGSKMGLDVLLGPEDEKQ